MTNGGGHQVRIRTSCIHRVTWFLCNENREKGLNERQIDGK